MHVLPILLRSSLRKSAVDDAKYIDHSLGATVDLVHHTLASDISVRRHFKKMIGREKIDGHLLELSKTSAFPWCLRINDPRTNATGRMICGFNLVLSSFHPIEGSRYHLPLITHTPTGQPKFVDRFSKPFDDLSFLAHDIAAFEAQVASIPVSPAASSPTLLPTILPFHHRARSI